MQRQARVVWAGHPARALILTRLVGEYPVPASDGGAVLAVQEGPVPAVAALEVADPALAPGPPLDQPAEAAAVLDDLTGR